MNTLVGDPAGARNLVRTAIDTFGKLDVLVNAAGILRDRTPVAELAELMERHVKPAVRG